MDRRIQKLQEEMSDAELLPIAREFVQQHNVVGIAVLHRHLNLAYGCAARLLDALEAEGTVGPAKVDGRKVLKRGTEPPST